MLCAVALRPASMRWTGVAGGNGAELDPKMAVNSSQNDQAGTPTALHIQLRPRRDRPLSMHDKPVAQPCSDVPCSCMPGCEQHEPSLVAEHDCGSSRPNRTRAGCSGVEMAIPDLILPGRTWDVALTSKVLRCAFPCCAALQPEAFAAPLAAAANKETFGFVAPVSLGQWKLMPGARQSPQTRMGHAEYRAPDSVKTPQLSSYPSSWALFGYGTVPWPCLGSWAGLLLAPPGTSDGPASSRRGWPAVRPDDIILNRDGAVLSAWMATASNPRLRVPEA
ncbi:hypothetical protein ACCO45_004883 [Purpureocillium lilacinum]|uniref:Uncharacterized protein n=1 Tax=Purpureocillium lilacinum TaxID=33203 RepID=A0ACC4DU29_PURLI